MMRACVRLSNLEITKYEKRDAAAADQGQETPSNSRAALGRSGWQAGRREVARRGRCRRREAGGGENFSSSVARIKRLIVKATCAREPRTGRREKGDDGQGGCAKQRGRGGTVSAIGARAWVERGGEKVAGVKVAINFSSRD